MVVLRLNAPQRRAKLLDQTSDYYYLTDSILRRSITLDRPPNELAGTNFLAHKRDVRQKVGFSTSVGTLARLAQKS